MEVAYITTDNSLEQSSKINILESKLREEISQKKIWFHENSNKTESSVAKLYETAEKMSNWCEALDAKINKAVTLECDKVREEFKDETNNINKKLKSQEENIGCLKTRVDNLDKFLKTHGGQIASKLLELS
jgi:predicted  nucleic acid-binding Zn-ribbon protein